MASFTLLNPPAWRSKDNTRPGIPALESRSTTVNDTQPMDPELQRQQQPPMYIVIERTSPTTISLIDLVTNTPVYRVKDTGRSSFSLHKKPDYEIFRCSSGDLFVGSIRIGKRGTDIRLPLTERKYDDLESTFALHNKTLRWRTKHIGRPKGGVDRSNAEEVRTASWVADLECVDENTEELCAAIKLVDCLPNGRFEIWMPDACVAVGGDWNLLDELVTLAYARMETVRRRILSGGSDPTGVGIAGMNLALGGGGFMAGGFGS